ncbi:MAG TPA: SRPBCC family protein [Phycisphaerales bacterium]|nr:SRPBCC family protein [Phycisphaerales bacterium]
MSTSATADREIVLTKLIEAPRELVFDLWTSPEEIGAWWGPQGFTTTTSSMNVRAGGSWRFTMHGPDGRDYDNLITYLEVTRPERLTYKHGGTPGGEPIDFQTTATFEPAGAADQNTLVTLRMTFSSAAVKEAVIAKYGALEGGKQTLGRLAEAAAMRRRGAGVEGEGRPFVITRVIQAPVELVYQLWTEREHLEQWFGPKGTRLTVSEMELRPGGRMVYRMGMADGSAHFGRWVFREITPPERLLFLVSFADERGEPVRAFFDETWPLEWLSEVTFKPHAGIGGGTVVTVTWTPTNATAAERRAFEDGHASMSGGWGGTFEQLAGYVGRLGRR